MATSGVSNVPRASVQIATDALRLAGIIDYTEEPASEDLNAALTAFRQMGRTWANEGVNLWRSTVVAIAWPAATATQTTAADDVTELRLTYAGGSRPLQRMSLEEYDRLPDKAAVGEPLMFVLTTTVAGKSITLWPVPSGAVSLYARLVRRPDDATVDGEPDVPPQHEEAVVYNLAARICTRYGRTGQRVGEIRADAERFYTAMKGADREKSVRFRLRRG